MQTVGSTGPKRCRDGVGAEACSTSPKGLRARPRIMRGSAETQPPLWPRTHPVRSLPGGGLPVFFTVMVTSDGVP